MMFEALAGVVSIAVVHSIVIEVKKNNSDLSDFDQVGPETRSWNAN